MTSIEGNKIKKLENKTRNFISHPYTRFVSKKGVFYLIVIFVALSLTFAIPRLMPGNPVQRVIRPPPSGISPEAMDRYMDMQEHMMVAFGLNKSLPEQYIDFWFGIFRLDFGVSYSARGRPILDLVFPRLFFTLALVIPVLFISFFVGNYIGGRAAFLKGKSNTLVYYFIVIVQSAPFYWLALLFYIIFVIDLQIFPVYGWSTPEHIPGIDLVADITNFIRYFILPFSVLLVGETGGWATGMRAMTLYEMDSEYLLYSQQLGFKKGLLQGYAQRNAILPQLTGLNLRLNGLIGQTLIIEAIFGWPGLGSIALNAVNAQDYPLIVGTFMITLIVVVVGNFLVDITYGFIDPRIRTGYGG
ncbi:MAG: ABC transporter permease [Candidatus Hodarchaeota archaeon]